MAIKTGNGDNNIIFGTQSDDQIYGKGGDDILLGGGGDDLLDGGTGKDTMQGGIGSDDYFVDNVNDKVVEYAGGGNWDEVFASITYTLPSEVEFLHLTGIANINGTGNELDNWIYGNEFKNTLYGLDGNDRLYGGGGNDILVGGGTSGEFGMDHLYGGTGDDIYVVDGDEWVNEYAGEGTDTIVSSISYIIPANVENLILTGTDDLYADGNELNNVIVGNDGNNDIDGYGGADTMRGGDGDDLYRVDQAGDVIVEYAGEGHDTVYSAASNYTLGANVEDLYLLGNANINGAGNDLDNVVWGTEGDNTLYGYGGEDHMVGDWGNDTMYGGDGDDTYSINDAGDDVIESANQGHDTVYVLGDLSYVLSDNVEDLYLQYTGQGVNATGNALDNLISGSKADNVIDGSLGADWMYGGLGDDEYYVDNSGDHIHENAGEGYDVVFSTVDYTLSANAEVLSLAIGTAVSGTGNAQDNVIYGSIQGNVIDGKAGKDSMFGGAGDDVYHVDNALDGIGENANEGNDKVYSTVNYTLSQDVETLSLQFGTAVYATGNDLNNTLFGNAGDNVLNGGDGGDSLSGLGGNDTFVFEAGQANGDVVYEFNGNGAGVGDLLRFEGYGPGATLNQMTATEWIVASNSISEVFTLVGAPALDDLDYVFV